MATLEEAIVASPSCTLIMTLILCLSVFFLYLFRRNGMSCLPRRSQIIAALERNGGTFVFKAPLFADRNCTIFTADPRNVQHILSTNLPNYPKGPDTKSIFEVYGEILFASDNDEWRLQRKLAHSFFHSQHFHHSTVKINKEILEKGLIPVLDHACKHGLMVDLQDVSQRFMLDTTIMMITGKNHGSLRIGFPKEDVLSALHDAGHAITFRHLLPESVWKFQMWLGIGVARKYRNASEILDNAAAEYIKIWKSDASKNDNNAEESFQGINSFDNMKELLQPLRNPDDVMREMVKAMIFGGTDTSSPVLPWLFWLLSKNPIAESKIRKELAENFNTNTSKNRVIFEPEELNKLVYLHAAICETMRLFPPVPFLSRTSTQADILPSGCPVKPNVRIILCTNSMGRMKSIWGEDCLEFKPERWITERRGIKAVASNKFLAFSAGPRICLGKEMAFIRIKAVAATILQNYQIQIAKDQPTPTPATSIVLHMNQSLMAKVIRRSSSSSA